MSGTVEDILIKIQMAREDLLEDEIGEWTVEEEGHDNRDPYVVIKSVESGIRYLCTLSDHYADSRLVIQDLPEGLLYLRCQRCRERFSLTDMDHNVAEVAIGLIHASCRTPGEEIA